MSAEDRRRCLLYVAYKMKVDDQVQKRQEICGHDIGDSKSISKIAETLTYAA